MEYRHKWECDVVVEEVTREGEVVCLNPVSRVTHYYCTKNAGAWNLVQGKRVESRSVFMYVEQGKDYYHSLKHFAYVIFKYAPIIENSILLDLLRT